MPVLSEVLGALAAGALVFVVARQAGVGVQSSLCGVAVVPIAVAAVLALPALRDGGATLLDKRKANAPLSEAEAQLQPGAVRGMNVAFLEWVKAQMAEGDTFHVEIGTIPEEVYVGGKGARQDAILQWSLFQLAPHLAVEQSEKARDLRPGEGLDADWLVFYESDPSAYPAGPLGEVLTYAPGFAIARGGGAG